MNSNQGLFRSSSSNIVPDKLLRKSIVTQNSNGLMARNSSLEQIRNLKLMKSSKSQPKSFIKAKPSSKSVKPSGSEELMKCNRVSEKVYPTCLKDYALLDEITSKFSLKTIELMKKEFPENESVYSNFLAFLSQVDSIFEGNKQLQFTMSRAKEVFHLYFSRPGHVLNTLKSLPKLTELNQVSKKVISQCSLLVKSIDSSKYSGVTLDVIESLKLIVSIQNKLFKTRVFVPKKIEIDDKADKTLEVSIMELTPLGEAEPSVSPVIPTEPDEEKSISASKSSKKIILEQLYQRIKSMPSKVGENKKEKIEEKQECLKEISLNAENLIKPKQKRMTSNSNVPGYMQNLRRKESVESQKIMKHSKVISKVLEKKKEWEEVRMRKKKEEEEKRTEMLKDLEEKRREKLEMQDFIKKKEKNEKLEFLKFKEQEMLELKRMKELEKQQKKLEFLDEFERNIKKSELTRCVSENF